jgi:hypothetical protein
MRRVQLERSGSRASGSATPTLQGAAAASAPQGETAAAGPQARRAAPHQGVERTLGEVAGGDKVAVLRVLRLENLRTMAPRLHEPGRPTPRTRGPAAGRARGARRGARGAGLGDDVEDGLGAFRGCEEACGVPGDVVDKRHVEVREVVDLRRGTGKFKETRTSRMLRN